jgi:hypothetical protein
MSSLFRNTAVRHIAAIGAASALLASSFTRPAGAQETNFVSFANVTAEWDSNRSLERPPQSAGTYGGQVGGELRELTPRSYTDLLAQVSYTDVPQLGFDWTSGSVALKSDFRTLEGDYTLLALYRRDDTFYTEFGHAAFNNDLTPTSPDTNGTANVTAGINRDSYELDPGFTYELTPRLELEGDFRFNAVNYSIETPGQRVDYTSPYAGLTLNWAIGPRSSFGIGPYYSRYEERDGANTTDTGGSEFTFNYKSSDITKMSVLLRVEHDRIDSPDLAAQSATAWGLEWVGTHRYRVGDVQFSIGRFLEPSSIGGRVSLDQFRAQFYRPLSARLSFSAAIRVTDAKLIGAQLTDDEAPEHRTNAETYLRFDVTPTLYVAAGYIFARAVDLGASNLAYSNGVLLTFGYRGVEPPRPVINR